MFEYVFKDISEADYVIKHMKDVIELYGYVTVSDFYDLVGITTDKIDNNRGWLNEASERFIVTECVDGYRAMFPEPIELLISANNKLLGIGYTPTSAEPDMVNHPPHYQSSNGIEVIDVIEAFTNTLVGIEATDTGNVLKYMCRWKYKNGLQDLEKAQWYLNHLINHIKEKENK